MRAYIYASRVQSGESRCFFPEKGGAIAPFPPPPPPGYAPSDKFQVETHSSHLLNDSSMPYMNSRYSQLVRHCLYKSLYILPVNMPTAEDIMLISISIIFAAVQNALSKMGIRDWMRVQDPLLTIITQLLDSLCLCSAEKIQARLLFHN